ncbi:unnamed protein product [Phytophthora fragariaefolia]|uniref:Unnamed protein product n=1 Tax=Phytophthora fragariaefolia TaxID=1490495 RepID=A0A9W6Y3B2_9STRA|nr:unnamed protein product [Phytophthora fragariaefolia]
MRLKTLRPNNLLQDDNYFLWEFHARMTLARKNLLSHVQVKSENVMEPHTAEWEAFDMKALGILVQLLSPNYQAMVREAKSAREAWETLRTFFAQKNLHNRVQLRKQLHSFEMASGENLMDHLMRFEDLCVRLSAVGEAITESEKVVILLGSLPPEYDGMIQIIEAHGSVTLLDAKEMLWREFETIKKRDRHEGAFRSDADDSRCGGVRTGAGRSGGERARDARGRRGGDQQQNRQRKDNGDQRELLECNKVGRNTLSRESSLAGTETSMCSL